MQNDFKCWKISEALSTDEQNIIKIGKTDYSPQYADACEIKAGTRCLEKVYVERKYKTQVAGLGSVCYEMRSERQELRFDELIFNSGICIGAYHDGLIILFDDEKTHYQEKYLGEMPTAPDQSVTFYDYYYLRFKKCCQ